MEQNFGELNVWWINLDGVLGWEYFGNRIHLTSNNMPFACKFCQYTREKNTRSERELLRKM